MTDQCEDLILEEDSTYIEFNAPINDEAGNVLLDHLTDHVFTEVERVLLHIKSNGGFTESGIHLHNQLRALPFKVTTFNSSEIESAATTFYLGGEERYVGNDGRFMIHGSYLDLRSANQAQIRGALNRIERDDDRIARIIARTTNIDETTLRQIFAKGTEQLYELEEALTSGIATQRVAGVKLPNKFKHIRIWQDENELRVKYNE